MRIDFKEGCKVRYVIIRENVIVAVAVAVAAMHSLLLFLLLLPSSISDYQRDYNMLRPRRAALGIGANEDIRRPQTE